MSPKVITDLSDYSTVAAVNASHSIYGFVFCLHRECAYAPNNWQESEATDSNVPVENVAGAYAEGYDVQIAKAIAEDLGKELVIVKLSWDGLIDALNHGQIEGVDHLSPVGSVPDMISRLQQGSCDAIVVNVENAPGYLASNPDFRLITFSEGSGFTLPAKGSCVGLRKSDTALLEQINEILGTLDNATRDEMWQTAVDNQPQYYYLTHRRRALSGGYAKPAGSAQRFAAQRRKHHGSTHRAPDELHHPGSPLCLFGRKPYCPFRPQHVLFRPKPIQLHPCTVRVRHGARGDLLVLSRRERHSAARQVGLSRLLSIASSIVSRSPPREPPARTSIWMRPSVASLTSSAIFLPP